MNFIAPRIFLHAGGLAILLAGLPASAADPADPSAAATPLRYTSAFEDYHPWREIATGDWRALNDALRDTHPATSAATQAPATASGAPAVPPSHGDPEAKGQHPHGHTGHGHGHDHGQGHGSDGIPGAHGSADRPGRHSHSPARGANR